MLGQEGFKFDEYGALGLNELDRDQWTDPETRVRDFISIYLNKENFNGVAIIKNEFTSNFHKYSQKDKSYFFIDSLLQAIKLKNELIKTSFSDGHLSALFLLHPNSNILEAYLKKKYYKKEKDFFLTKGLKNQPICTEDIEAYFDLFNELRVGVNFKGLTFSHDAEYLYLIE